ncbi:MAG TPA: chromate transporter [Acholeplasmataceae bacterium]|nr:chromate transporter [Acholeplasmataceae bacterium]
MITSLLRLFFIFFKIGLFTFGGGYAMIPMIRQDMLHYNYLTEEQITLFIGIAESTPGPFAINIATFAGFHSEGFIGAIVATLAVFLPSFIIILLIAYFSGKILKHPLVKNALDFLKPVVVGLVATAALNVLFQVVFKTNDISMINSVDYKSLLIFIVVFLLAIIFKKQMTPVKLILISAILGIVVFAF